MSAAVVQPAVWQVAPGAGAQRQHARVVTVTTVRLPTATTSGPTVGHGTPHIGHRIALWLRRETHLPDWATLMVVSALPVVELRGGVPVGLWLGLSPIFTFFLCVLGNMLPIPFLLWALQHDRVRQWARPLFDSVSRRLPAHSGTRSSQALALALFVGLPRSCCKWTGGLHLSLIGVGVVIAGCIMTALVMLGRLGALIVSFVLLGVGASALWRAVRQASS
ncbi:hypothetical protein F1559_000148 [Cyanidiococcus yangmingshanensis]|uniref:Uncharacterized protein n=1 Tax=Cyanidiococcus yangmingshanensis TaxID=2690220 RepID=A0A7J7IE37_9RHOD|nr:hypothetical protein F1559_000148 [Cyanidiococcus yangmingshanensis]